MSFLQYCTVRRGFVRSISIRSKNLSIFRSERLLGHTCAKLSLCMLNILCLEQFDFNFQICYCQIHWNVLFPIHERGFWFVLCTCTQYMYMCIHVFVCMYTCVYTCNYYLIFIVFLHFNVQYRNIFVCVQIYSVLNSKMYNNLFIIYLLFTLKSMIIIIV